MARPEKIGAGYYKYRGCYILRTEKDDGPRGGKRYQWEIGHDDPYAGVVLDSIHWWPTMREVIDYLDNGWAIIAADEGGITVEREGRDPDALANHVASWAQQEVDKWPEMGLIYMLIPIADVPVGR